MIGVIASVGKTIKALGTNSPLTMTFGGTITSIFSRLTGQVQQINTLTQEGTEVQNGYRVVWGNTANALSLATIKTGLMTTAMTLLNTVITGAVIGAIVLVGKAIYDYVNASEIAHDKIAENIEVTKSTISSYKEQKSQLKDIAKEYDELSSKSNKSNDELERYNELQNQIAEIAPDLVIGTDANNNPILALNGSLQDYIDGLDEAIERQQKLLMNQQNSLASKSRQKLKNITRSTETTYGILNSNNYSEAFDDRNDSPWNSAQLKNIEDGAEKYVKIIEKRNKAIDDLNIELAESFEEFNSIEMEQQQSVLNKLTDETKYESFNKLGKQTKNAMETLIDNFNWGSSVVETTAGQEKFIKNFDLLSEKIGKNKSQVQEWNKVLNNANQAWQETGDLEQYKKDISSVAKEIAKLTDTDVNDWITGFANELQGSLNEESISLNQFLKSYNKTYSDIQNKDKIAVKLSLEYNDTSNFLKDLTSAGTHEEMVNYLVNVNTGEVKYDNLPYQIKELLKGSLDGGKNLKDYERRVIMKVATEIQSNGELDDKTFGLISKMLNGEMTETEIKAGIELPDGQILNEEVVGIVNQINKDKKKNVKIGVELAEDKLDDDLETLLNGEKNKELRVNLKTAFEDKKFETFNDLIKDMSTDKQIDIATAFVSYGDLSPEEMEQFIKSLPEEVQTVIKTIYDNSGIDDAENSLYNIPKVQTIIINAQDEDAKNKITSLIDNLDKMDIDKEVKIGIIENASKGTTQGIIDALNLIKDLPTEQKLTIVSNLQDIMIGLEGLDKKQISDKIAKIIGQDDASDDINKVENNNPDDKNVNINATDNATDKINKVEKQASTPSEKKVNIIVDVIEKVKGALKLLNSGVGGIYSKADGSTTHKSIGDFTNISNNPEMIDSNVPTTFSRSFTNLSNNPETTDSSNTSTSNVLSTFKTKALRPFTGIGSSTTLDTSINISKNTLDSIEYSVKLLQELEYRIDNINDKLSLLDVKMENATGTEKIKYLQKQNSLYEEQAKLQKQLYDNLTEEKKIIKDKLKNYGFKFDAQGNLTEYEEKLISLNKQVDELEKKSEKASKSSSSSKSSKKSSSSSSNPYESKLEKLKEKLETVKNLTDEYLQIQRDDIPSAEKEWLELQNSIKKNNDEIEKLELEDKLYKFKNSVTGLNNQYDIWADKIDLIDTKLSNSLETEKIALMSEKLTALNKQLEIQEKTLNSLKNQIPVYQNALSKYGIEFGKNGNIVNMSTILNKYQNTEDLEKINDLMEEYNNLVRDTIPNAEKEYSELNNAIQDVYNTQLETVKDIEDKMTDVIKDQLDKRKELIQKQYDSEIDLLNKRKDEYNKNKDTNDYYKDLEEAQNEINNIQKKINIVSLDDSLQGRSKLSEYLDDLKEAQDKYNDLVANRTDTLINDMYDNEIDRLQQESENKIQSLEDTWTDSKIAEIVAESLGAGVFTDIDGEVHNLQDTLITFAEDSGEALGVLGDKIKNELSLNLQEALDYIKEYDDIINSMGLKQLGNVNYSDKVNSKSLAIDDISINVYGTEGMNEKQLAEEVKKQIEDKFSEITNGGLL